MHGPNPRRLTLASVLSVLLLSGCARVSPTSDGTSVVAPSPTDSSVPTPSQTYFGDQPPPINWSDPIPRGSPEPSLTQAASDLSFAPVQPKGLGDPQSIEVSDPGEFDQNNRSVAFTYEDPSMGSFAVIELVSQESQADLEAQLSYNDDPSNTEQLSLITIRGGTEALLSVGPNTTSVQWLQNGLLMIVIGPSSSFTADDAVSVANNV